MSKINPIQLSIPNPCHEDWAQMTPDQRGRFCSHCQKSVVDFTGYTDNELAAYFINNKTTHTCGRFYSIQLHTNIYKQLPVQHTQLYKHFVALGLTLMFSQLPAKAQERYMPVVSTHFNQADTALWIGTIYDNITHQVLPAVTINIIQGYSILQTQTDINGHYLIKNLEPGRYEMQVSLTGYDTLVVKDIIITPKKMMRYNLQLTKSTAAPGKYVWAFKLPLVDPNDSSKVVSAEEIENMTGIVIGMVNTENKCYVKDGIVTYRWIDDEWTEVARLRNGIVTHRFTDGKLVAIPRPNFIMRLWIHTSIALRLRHPQAVKYNQPL